MVEYKKYALDMLKGNEEVLKSYLKKIGLLEKEPGNSYEDVEAECYKLLAEYDRLVIYDVEYQREIFEKLFETFKDDERVEFWVKEQNIQDEQGQLISQHHKRNWINSDNAELDYDRLIFDYGNYKILERAEKLENERVVIINDEKQQNEKIGYAEGEKKEKNLCKVLPKLMKSKKDITVYSSEERTLLYIKGLMKGTGAVNSSITFAFLVGTQDYLLKQFKNEMYSVVPVMALEKDKNWNNLIRQTKRYKNEILLEYNRLQHN